MVSSQTCAIIGNGPSVTTAILESLACDTFGLNFVATVYPDTNWRPTHYLFGASKQDRPEAGFGLVQQSVALGIPSWIRDDWRNEIHGQNVRYFSAVPGNGWPVTDKLLFAGHTAVYYAAQVASLLGYKSLIFIGLDGYKPWADEDPNHVTPGYFRQPGGLSEIEAAIVNAGNTAGYIRMVGYLRALGIECSFVVPPSRIGLEIR